MMGRCQGVEDDEDADDVDLDDDVDEFDVDDDESMRLTSMMSSTSRC